MILLEVGFSIDGKPICLPMIISAIFEDKIAVIVATGLFLFL